MVNFSTGLNNKFLVPSVFTSVSKLPNNIFASTLSEPIPTPVLSDDFSNNKASFSVVRRTNSLNCVSDVSGSVTWIK